MTARGGCCEELWLLDKWPAEAQPGLKRERASLEARLDSLAIEALRERVAAWRDVANLAAERRRWQREYDELNAKWNLMKSLEYRSDRQ